MIIITFVFALITFCESKPWEEDILTRNVVTVPPNCPPGQEWFNGACRDVWRYEINAANILVQQKCTNGQIFVYGKCQSIWINNILLRNLNGENQNIEALQSQPTRIVPQICPLGQKWYNDACREMLMNDLDSRNVVTVPPNCPAGQEWFNGACRDVWRSNAEIMRSPSTDPLKMLMQKIKEAALDIEENIDTDSRNIISVPHQCPPGYKPDALGYCREILN